MCREEELLELDAHSLGALLGSDDLNISQEESVLELVLHWVERRRGDMQSEAQAVELLRRVRLELVDPGFLRKARRRYPVRRERGRISPLPFLSLSIKRKCQIKKKTKKRVRLSYQYFFCLRSCCEMLSVLG